MTEYRAYALDPDDHISSSYGFESTNDTEAIEQAKRLVAGCDIELWNLDRFVVRLKHLAEP